MAQDGGSMFMPNISCVSLQTNLEILQLFLAKGQSGQSDHLVIAAHGKSPPV